MIERPTIAALATAPQPSAVAVIRVSGPKTKMAVRSIFRSKNNPLTHARQLVFGAIRSQKGGQIIDRGLCVFMPAPHSFTGEDYAEFHTHGSPLILQKILRSLYATGIEAAEAGEFSKRAFLNGKLDLTQAEAIADLISAGSDRALQIAAQHLQGKLSGAVEQIGEPLREVLAEVEASLDFADEDVPAFDSVKIGELLEKAKYKIEVLLGSYGYGQALKDGFRVLLCGKPNVGKSTLLNAFLGRERAIVTHISGTTRDLLEEEALLGGYRFVFCDSAGIRESSDMVEKIGIELAKSKIPWADLVMLVVDAQDREQSWKEILDLLNSDAKKIWLIVNKIDLNPEAITNIYCDSQICAQNFYVSATGKAGFAGLIDALISEVEGSLPQLAETSEIVTNERHILCLERAKLALQSSVSLCDGKQNELLSLEVRNALQSLAEIVGQTYNEDILGRIFSKFCIGK